MNNPDNTAMEIIGTLQMLPADEAYSYLVKTIAERDHEAAKEISELHDRLRGEIIAWRLAAFSCGLYRADAPHNTPEEWQRSQLNAASTMVAELTQLRAERERIWKHCQVIFFPPYPAYPLEHNLAAYKDNRAMIEAGLKTKG